MKFYNKISIIFLVIFLVWKFFVVSAFPVLACWSVSCVASELEKRYHLNLGSIQNQGENFNVSDQKKITPEVSLFFSPSDPKEGEKISAKAFPVYFSNPEEALYYTWYLKRKECVLRNNVRNTRILDLCNASDPKRGTDDRENPGDITIEDWKIEAARIIAQNGYEGKQKSSDRIDDDGKSGDNDEYADDGYKAKFGGENKVNVPNKCYVHDPATGINHELVEHKSETKFICPDGFSPVCMVVNEDDTNECDVSGIPTCSDNGSLDTLYCDTGSPRCLDNSTDGTACSDFSALTSCSTVSELSANPVCNHLFPNAPDEESGDGEFNEEEENFWGTDPTDPDTADNGNKDEANVVGLGSQTFTWNYTDGDLVGVTVEGTSMIQTKHDESSFMIMWAFSENDCQVPDDVKSSYTKSIKGYNVVIPTAAMDLNSCIEKNLVDPMEGGQATNLDVAITAIPENPVNDETEDKAGDTVIAQASISNSQSNLANTIFEWEVGIGNSISNIAGSFTDITEDLQKAGLLDNTEGNAIDSIAVKMDISEDTFQDNDKKIAWNEYTFDGVAYLRFKVTVTEHFSGGKIRKGKSDVIVKFTSSPKKIMAYIAEAELGSDREKPKMKVVLPENLEKTICDKDTLDTQENILDHNLCRIIRNEVIGLEIDPTGLSNFHWTINGAPLLCSYWHVSEDCSDQEDAKQNNVNFFPATGDVGDTYTVTVTANDTTTDYTDDEGSNKGDTITLTRTFHIVEPMVSIKSLDESIVWPKLLGQYKDITGATNCPGGLCNDYSTVIFQAFSNGELGFKAAFIPSFLRDISIREWRVDGEVVEETAPGEIHFTAAKMPWEIYNVDLAAQVTLDEEIRRALLDIWNVSPFDSTEINFATAIQTELKEPGIVQGPFQNERKYLAALVSYIPSSFLFTFRIILSAGLLLFVASFLSALLQDRRAKIFANEKF